MAGGFELAEFMNQFESEVTERDDGIESEGGHESIGGEDLMGDMVEALAEGGDVLGSDGEAGGHGMAAVANEQVTALVQGGGEVEALDTAAGSAPFVAVAAEDDAGAVEGLEEAGGDDADHAHVPEQLAFDDDIIECGVEMGADGADGFVGDSVFDALAFAVLGIEGASQFEGGGGVGGEEQVEGLGGAFEAAGGVEAGGELEGDFVRADGAGDLGDVAQGDEAGASAGVEAVESGADHGPVLPGDGDEVGQGAEGDEIESGAQVERVGLGPIEFAALADEAVGEFEGEADGGQFVAGLGSWGVELGVDEG